MIVICFISGEICQDSSTQFRNLLFLLHRFEVIKSNESIYIKIKYQIEQNFNKKINFCIGINSVDQKTFYFGSNTKLEVKNPIRIKENIVN